MALSHRGFLGSRISGRALEIGVCATASSGFLLFGYDQGVMSGIITEDMFLQQFPMMQPSNKSGAIQALVVAIYEIGCLIGSLLIVGVGDKLGRRRAVLIGAVIMLIGAAIQASSFSLAQLIVGRIVTGVGNGMNTSSIPVWQSEMAPPKIRGFLVLFEGALITGGVMISYWINYGFYFVRDYNSFQWRFPISFQCFFGVLLIIGILAFPESPRWLLKKGKKDEAVEILARLYQTTVDDEDLKADVAQMEKANAEVSKSKLTPKEFLSNGKSMNLWRASVACAAQAFQQIGGINLVTYYATTVFETSLGFDGQLSRLLTGCLGTEYFASACLALFIVDRLGRRRLMIGGAFGMAASLLIIGACLSKATPEYKAPAFAATVFIFFYNSFFAVGWLGTTWLYPAEVTSLRIRAEVNGFSTSANWIFNYAVVQLSPIMINTISWKTYFVFMCFNLAFIPIVYYTFVETNGWKLESLDIIFSSAHEKGENPVWVEKRLRKQKDRLNKMDEIRNDDDDEEKSQGTAGVEDIKVAAGEAGSKEEKYSP